MKTNRNLHVARALSLSQKGVELRLKLPSLAFRSARLLPILFLYGLDVRICLGDSFFCLSFGALRHFLEVVAGYVLVFKYFC